MAYFTPLNQEDAAYLAGFVDGEGTIIIIVNKKRPQFTLRVIVANTHEEVIRWIAEKINGCVQHLIDPNGREADIWNVDTSSNHALALLRAIRPYLKVKAEQADVGIAFQELMQITSQRGVKLSQEVIAVRTAYADRLKALRRKDKQYSLPKKEGTLRSSKCAASKIHLVA